MNLANLYRPERFEDVYGQAYPVRFLSGLIKHGQHGRNLLLHGAVGSGKTSLVRLYAKALNCEEPTQTGSPCGSCRFCKALDREDVGLKEYDVSGKGGEVDQVVPWVEEHHRSPVGRKYTVLFFDEAHSLTVKASDALLKAVEEPRKNVVFSFATTEYNRMRPALVSRLHPLEVRPLAQSTAIKFLKNFAEKVNVTLEPDALSMLAAVGRGFPRDLLTGLELLAGLGESHITLQHVKEAFDIDHTDKLVDYFIELADGNLALQTDIIFGWQDPLPEKVQWVQALLASIYYNDLLGRSVTIDPFTSSIAKSLRQDVVDRFCRRMGLNTADQLAPAWRRMMEFWPATPDSPDDAAIALRLTLFHDLVNNDLLTAAQRSSPPIPAPIIEQKLAEQQRSRTETPIANAEAATTINPAYPSKTDVRDIIRASSFLTQQYGCLFNAAMEVRPDLFGCRDEESSVSFIVEFCNDLERRMAEPAEALSAWVSLIERDAFGLPVGLVLASIPRPRSRSARGFLKDASRWCQDYKHELRRHPKNDAITLLLAPEERAGQVKFHWRQTLNLCAGLDEGVMEFDRRAGNERPLLDLLAIPPGKRRQPGPIRIRPFKNRLFGVCQVLGEGAMETAAHGKMQFLSAFDDKAWTWIGKGWELAEYLDRVEAKKEREEQIAAVVAQHEDSGDRLEAVKKLEGEWPHNPRMRQRRWTGWWSEIDEVLDA